MAKVRITETVFLTREEDHLLTKACEILRSLFADASSGRALETKIDLIRDNLADLLDKALIEY